METVDDDSKRKLIWLSDALQSLSHPRPDNFNSIFSVKNNVADQELHSLTLWLEERVIRIWDFNRRDSFLLESEPFWRGGGFEKYLNDLEFPMELSFNRDHNSSAHIGEGVREEWKNNVKIRSRIVFWLIQCAINETYLDKTNNRADKNDEEAEADKTFSKRQTSAVDESDTFHKGSNLTNEKVNTFLTSLRMYHLLELREMQDIVNVGISEMQKLTVKQIKGRKKKEC